VESPIFFTRKSLLAIFALILLAAVAAWYFVRRAVPPVSPGFPAAVMTSAFDREPIAPLPDYPDLDPRKVALGEQLFHDTRLSADDTLSCASCHDMDKGGVDRVAHSRGIGGAAGNLNAPTVFNSGFNFRQFWDGRAASLEEQAAGPVHNPIEMGSSWPQVLDKLKRDKHYLAAFAELYPDGLQSHNIQDAIAAFERSLVTPSRFDRFLRGERGALDAVEQAGYLLFKNYGCTACHQGVNVGGNMYQSLGIFGDFFADRGKDAPEDQGRFNVTRREEDRHRFKVPSLRNVALTAPYFHDGSVAQLEEAIRIMGRYQLGRELGSDEVGRIAAFLKSLNGAYRGKPL
jgi:cytochrome c peroxidase